MAGIVEKNKNGYGYKYTDIAQIHEYLESQGISYWQYTERIGDDDYIFTVPIINGEEKPARRGCRIVNGNLLAKSNVAQELGAAITYARRYSLLMAFGLATDDDDAECLTRNKDKKEKKPEKISSEQIATLKKALAEVGVAEDYPLRAARVSKYEDLTVEQFVGVMNKCKAKKEGK